MRHLIFIFLIGCYAKFFLYVTHAWWNHLISRKLVIIEILLLLFLTISAKKILFGSCAGSWSMFKDSLKRFLLYCVAEWNNSVRTHFSTIEKPLCVSIGAALFIAAGTYCLIPYTPFGLQEFIPEQISLYSMVDSFPQRIAYQVFLAIIIISALYFGLFQKKFGSPNIITARWSTILGVLVLIAAILSFRSAQLDIRAETLLIVTIVIAFMAYSAKLPWFAWVFITILVTSTMLFGWLHTPEPPPPFSFLKWADQHYDSFLYRGRQLAAGHLFSANAPALYSMLWTTSIGIFSKKYQPPTFADLIRFVQVGQLLCFSAFMLAALLRTRGQSNNTRAVVLTFFTVAVLPWLSIDSASTWLPTQSGLRFLFFPIAICTVFIIERMSAIRAGAFAGLIAGLALIANFETGVAVTAGLGVAWLVKIRSAFPRIWLTSAVIGVAAILGCYFTLDLTYHYFFGASILPDGIDSLFKRLTETGKFGGLKLPFRSIVIVILAHASYIFIQSFRALFNHHVVAPNAVTSAIVTMLLVWMPYYVNRPDDWNLWSFIALYSLLLIPSFTGGKKDILPFIVLALIVLPIPVRHLTYNAIEQLNYFQSQSDNKQVCAGGLILSKDFCAHIQKRAKTLQYFSSQGSVEWSTSLPILTDQTTKISSNFWTGNLLAFTFTPSQFKELVKKIKKIRPDLILFDDPDDPFILPRPSETSFDRKLYESLHNDYCKPQLQGGWLVAHRKRSGSCEPLKMTLIKEKG